MFMAKNGRFGPFGRWQPSVSPFLLPTAPPHDGFEQFHDFRIELPEHATTDATQVQAEVTDKVDDVLTGAAETPAPTTPEAATPSLTPEKPAETPAAPPEGGEKK